MDFEILGDITVLETIATGRGIRRSETPAAELWKGSVAQDERICSHQAQKRDRAPR
jgi:hypothetical protein